MKFRSLVALLLFLVIRSQSYTKAYQTITTQELVNYVSKALKTPYLQKYQGKIRKEYQGIVYGIGSQLLVSIPVRLHQKSCPTYINVVFLVDTSFPLTTLKDETFDKLYQNCPQITRTFSSSQGVMISDYLFSVQLSKIYGQTMNVLGARFLNDANTHFQADYVEDREGSFKLVFQGSRLKERQDEEL